MLVRNDGEVSTGTELEIRWIIRGMLNILLGWILGVAGTLIVDLWRGRGRVMIASIHVFKRGAGEPLGQRPEQLVCGFSLRALNTYPSEKSLTVEKVEFHRQRSAGRSATPLYTDPLPKIGYSERDLRARHPTSPEVFDADSRLGGGSL